ncbi:DUF5662 family protein [Treponema sp.]|uniref:DUF5662 family protein n=1 Tax=Treponema sp. TaxID=166 RepID=UPI003FA1FB74
MTITYEYLPQAIQSLKKCAKEREKEYISWQLMNYDSTKETVLHIKRVNELLLQFTKEVIDRAIKHDNSKLQEPEKPLFDKMTPLLKGLTYGSNEYKKALDELKPALKHHYENNSHHPEHYKNGIDDFTLVDLVEMFFDWKATSERHADGNMFISLEINKKRFGMSEQLYNIFKNTAIHIREWEK